MPFRSSDRTAGWNLPGSLDAMVAADHSVRFVATVVDGLEPADWQELGVSVEARERGSPRYHPLVLLSVWVWGFMLGIRSSRRLEEACRERVSFWWLTGRQCPDHNTLWRSPTASGFPIYQAHRTGMRLILKLTVQTAVRLELVDLALQAVDGSKIAGNAAKDRTYDRAGLDRLEERIDQAIRDLEAQNSTDDEPPPPRLPKALASMQNLREEVQRARAELVAGDQERVNLTDPDARLQRSRSGYVAGYNAQIMVSPLAAAAGRDGMLITAAAVTTDPDDHSQLAPMLDAAAETTGQRAEATAADAGYHSGPNLAACAERHQPIVMPEANAERVAAPYHQSHFRYDAATDTYTCPQDQTLTFVRSIRRAGEPRVREYGQTSLACCQGCPAFGVCTTNQRGRTLQVSEYEAALRTHRQWMATDAAKAVYARRKELAEPVFGIIKEQRSGRRFLLRGVANVQAEWSLLAAAFNLRTLAAIWQRRTRRASSLLAA